MRRVAVALLALAAPAAAEAPRAVDKSVDESAPAWVEACRARLERARVEGARLDAHLKTAKTEVTVGRTPSEPRYSVALVMFMGTAQAASSRSTRASGWREEARDGGWRASFRDADGRSAGLNVGLVDERREKLLPLLRAALDDCLAASASSDGEH